MNNTPDFKRLFNAAVRNGVTVMECGTVEDYFHITELEMHTKLSTYAEFAVQCVTSADEVGMDQVMMVVKNLHDLVGAFHTRLGTLRASAEDHQRAKDALFKARKNLTENSASISELFENELGMTLDTE